MLLNGSRVSRYSMVRGLPVLSGIVIYGRQFLPDPANVEITDEYIRTTIAGVIAFSWFLPAGETELTINIDYNDEIDIAGSRPVVRLSKSPGIGIPSDVEEITPSGGGDHDVLLSFGPTTVDGFVSVTVNVPESGLPIDVTATPMPTSGQSVSASVNGASGGGSPITGQRGGILRPAGMTGGMSA